MYSRRNARSGRCGGSRTVPWVYQDEALADVLAQFSAYSLHVKLQIWSEVGFVNGQNIAQESETLRRRA